MNLRRVGAMIFTIVTLGAVAFQVALALGAPWGAYAMGGAFPGQFSPPMRIAAVVQAVLLLALAGVVLARAGLALKPWARASRWLAWIVVAFSAVSLVLNLITPSGGERLIWAPVAAVMLVTSVIVATGRQAA